MRKSIAIIVALIAASFTASAQRKVLAPSKWYDNTYIGINGGGATPTTKHSWIADATPNFGLRLGKNITPILGFVAEGNAYFESACAGKGPDYHTKTFIENLNVNLLASFNVSNLLLGYNGEPRLVEVSVLGGYGWGHAFGKKKKQNLISSKLAIDLTLNLGADKQWQIYVEPSMNYGLQNYNSYTTADKFKYNINKSNFQVNVGINYKLRNHDGSHNFKLITARDENEIKSLNNKIHALRQEQTEAEEAYRKVLAEKDAEIAILNETIEDYKAKAKSMEQSAYDNSLRNVISFGNGKTAVDNAQMDKLEMVANYLNSNPQAKLMIKGYTSFNKEGADLMSEKRAFNVLVTLVKKYRVSIDRLESEGSGYDKAKGDVVVFEKMSK